MPWLLLFIIPVPRHTLSFSLNPSICNQPSTTVGSAAVLLAAALCPRQCQGTDPYPNQLLPVAQKPYKSPILCQNGFSNKLNTFICTKRKLLLQLCLCLKQQQPENEVKWTTQRIVRNNNGCTNSQRYRLWTTERITISCTLLRLKGLLLSC